MTVLDDIVSRTRVRLEQEPRPDRRMAEDVAASRESFAFRRALQSGVGPRVIAEIKAASPSAGAIVPDPDIEAIAREYADGGAAALSIVTEPEFFRGSHEWIARARDAAGLPVVMKDFVVEPAQIVRGVAAGADAMLLLASLLETNRLSDYVSLLEAYGCDALVEVHDEAELAKALEARATIIGVNNRDLRDFRVDLATSETLGARIPEDVIRVAESGIQRRADIDRLAAAGFRAFLVGESLLRQADRTAAVKALIGESTSLRVDKSTRRSATR